MLQALGTACLFVNLDCPMFQENVMLKDQIEALMRENSILKRAVAIQHERQKECDEKNHEVQNLKQLIIQYQEQLRTLEVRITHFGARILFNLCPYYGELVHLSL